LDADVAAFCRGHPLADVVRLRTADLQLVLQALEGVGVLAGDGSQYLTLDGQVIVGGNFLRHDQVIAGLRFMRVGNGCRPHLEIAFGRLQLFCGCRFLGARRRQGFLGQQHIEVGLGNAHDQVLAGLKKLGFGTGCRELSLLVARPVLPAKQGLCQGQRPGIAVVIDIGLDTRRPGRRVEIVAVSVGDQPQSGQ